MKQSAKTKLTDAQHFVYFVYFTYFGLWRHFVLDAISLLIN